MIPADFIAEWREQVPWVQESQVEQDLVISRALIEIFAHDHLARIEIDFDRVVHCFVEYLSAEGHSVSRAELEANLAGKLQDPVFLADLQPLLAPGITWDLEAAVEWAFEEITPRLRGDRWKGIKES